MIDKKRKPKFGGVKGYKMSPKENAAQKKLASSFKGAMYATKRMKPESMSDFVQRRNKEQWR
jgi:hypothetical protein